MAKNKNIETPLGVQLNQVITNLLVTKARLPPILDLVAELKVLGDEHRVRSGIVLQMARDSFDMCVIDLASLREQMVMNEGIVNQLRHHLHKLVQKKSEDFDPAGEMVGDEGSKARDSLDEHLRTRLATYHNDALARLFPSGPPAGEADVDGLVKRFREDTQPIDDDRNKVRAHRYEVPRHLSNTYYLTPEKVQKQLAVFERYLNDMLLVLEGMSHAMNEQEQGNRQRSVESLADVIIWGSINEACNEYGVTSPSAADPHPWYWKKREEYLNAQRPRPTATPRVHQRRSTKP